MGNVRGGESWSGFADLCRTAACQAARIDPVRGGGGGGGGRSKGDGWDGEKGELRRREESRDLIKCSNLPVAHEPAARAPSSPSPSLRILKSNNPIDLAHAPPPPPLTSSGVFYSNIRRVAGRNAIRAISERASL